MKHKQAVQDFTALMPCHFLESSTFVGVLKTRKILNFTLSFQNERGCQCNTGYVGDGLQCLEKAVPPTDRCLEDNGGCHPKASCKDLHFHSKTVVMAFADCSRQEMSSDTHSKGSGFLCFIGNVGCLCTQMEHSNKNELSVWKILFCISKGKETIKLSYSS